ncbi:methyltransferase family protein [Georgenia subflava]|uniref:Isoprenylcysteine carboxylmethyltransferase family protein n=1 Tax=Georgenia subflava TaxID=1622177 RepID=A0A6N7EMV5_9MICO|nr:isoprenylcysteine carboxylmethyltransferase family protein [Georgenia subflava]MPV38458.1 isoprenylcysteine carboxylmethyltransferase family protein [Georgenia subflava]
MDRSDALVAAQALALVAVAARGRPRWRLSTGLTVAAGTLVVGGGALALAGVVPHQGRVSPRVRPPAGAHLITTGPYAVTRNPIYAGLALATTGVAILRRRPLPLVAAGVLAVVLTAKARLEEDALAERFGDAYSDYAAHTPRLLGLPRHSR